MIGLSPAFQDMSRLIGRYAGCDAPVLIEGETGTGKELAARTIHYQSARRDHPFIPVNCGALPDTLMESELFGYRRGAFTDARQDRAGLVDHARGGTLFLDEIETLSTKGQVTLLRFLQDQRFRPLGRGEERSADVRVIAASNSRLDALAQDGQFRQDLLYRLNVLLLVCPPLRERGGDVAMLAEHFLARCASQSGIRAKRLHPDSLAWLEAQAWPGNIRELENLIYRECLLADGEEIRVRPSAVVQAGERRGRADRRVQAWWGLAYKQARSRVLEEFERQYLSRLLAESRGNVTRAALRAGKERRALGKLLKKHGIDRSAYLVA
ncbi:MAG: sigma-54 dependent transcriptional regulator [Thiobacillaceae bacterium]|nr:sigma-54 dependent transcriptional regulator [Thiobacillaceae bacterium]